MFMGGREQVNDSGVVGAQGELCVKDLGMQREIGHIRDDYHTGKHVRVRGSNGGNILGKGGEF